MYPASKPKKLAGTEPLITSNGAEICPLIDFWRWAHSDLLGNSERGVLAEFIVACALGLQNSERVSWDRYDLVTKEGIRIEVKASGYLQTWEQKELSKLTFGIQPTFGWNSQTNEYELKQKRQSDIYVFCVHNHTDKTSADPLQISQWDFYLLPTAVPDTKFQKRKSATLSALIRAGAELCAFENLQSRIKDMILK